MTSLKKRLNSWVSRWMMMTHWFWYALNFICVFVSFYHSKNIKTREDGQKKEFIKICLLHVLLFLLMIVRILNYESRPQRSATSCSNVSVVASNGIDLHLLFEQMECYATHSVGEYFFSLRLFIALAMEKMPVILQARELPRDCNMGIYFKKGAINFCYENKIVTYKLCWHNKSLSFD